MADYLGVARNTVSTWINGKIVPSVQTLRLWALRTGVPFEWLQNGTVPHEHDGGDDPTGNGVTREYRGSVTPIMKNRLRKTDSSLSLMLPLRKVS